MNKWICSHCGGANHEDVFGCQHCGNPYDESDTRAKNDNNRTIEPTQSMQLLRQLNRVGKQASKSALSSKDTNSTLDKRGKNLALIFITSFFVLVCLQPFAPVFSIISMLLIVLIYFMVIGYITLSSK